MKQIIVVGGGASGLVAAIFAAREGSEVTILERTNRVGKKILATGNGRCNITNIDCNMNHFHGAYPKFALGSLTAFDQNDAIQFFEELGITHKVEAGGKVYPYSDQASSVLDVLRMEVERLGIHVLVEKEVTQLQKTKEVFKVKCKDSSAYTADKVIMATGGKAAPHLGSNGSGLLILESLGHHVIPPFPALVQIVLDTDVARKVKGVKFQGKVAVFDEKGQKKEENGEILFTEDGISGPPVFQISRIVSKQRMKNKNSTIILDLFPGYTLDELVVILQMRIAYQPQKAIGDFLIGLVNKRLIPQLLKAAYLEDSKRSCSLLSQKEIMRLASLLKQWEFIAIGTRSWTNAQVMAGGIDTSEMDIKTLQSKKVKGLYVIGELLDIDGDCGGFNLQWAWSTAYVAGTHAATTS